MTQAERPTKAFRVVSIHTGVTSLGVSCDRAMIQAIDNPDARKIYPLSVKPDSLCVGDIISCYTQSGGKPYLSYQSPFCMLDSQGKVAADTTSPRPEPTAPPSVTALHGTRFIVDAIHAPEAGSSTTQAVARHTATHRVHTLIVPASWYHERAKLGANVKAVRDSDDQWIASA